MRSQSQIDLKNAFPTGDKCRQQQAHEFLKIPRIRHAIRATRLSFALINENQLNVRRISQLLSSKLAQPTRAPRALLRSIAQRIAKPMPKLLVAEPAGLLNDNFRQIS